MFLREKIQLQLLYDVVAKRRPELLPLARKVGYEKLTMEQLAMLHDVVYEEFIEEGLQQDSEPNARGILVDELHGLLVYEEQD